MLHSSIPEGMRTSQGDLSLSELSLQDRTVTSSDRPFTLLKPEPKPEPQGEDEENDVDVDDVNEEDEKETRTQARGREEKLQSDLFILRKLNSSFAMYSEALDNTNSANQVSPFPVLSDAGTYMNAATGCACPAYRSSSRQICETFGQI